MRCAECGESTDAVTWNVIREESWVGDVRVTRTSSGGSRRCRVVNGELARNGTCSRSSLAKVDLMKCSSQALWRALCSQRAAPSTPSQSGLEVATRRARMCKRARRSHSSARPRGIPPPPTPHTPSHTPPALHTPYANSLLPESFASTSSFQNPTAASGHQRDQAPATAKME